MILYNVKNPICIASRNRLSYVCLPVKNNLSQYIVFGFLITCLFQPGLFANRACIADTEKKPENRRPLAGSLSHKETKIQGKWYFRIHLNTGLPSDSFVQTSIFYRKKMPQDQGKNTDEENWIEIKADSKTTRISSNGELTTYLLGLNRKLWAGSYKLQLKLNPTEQYKTIRNQLSGSNKSYTRTVTWFHKTPEKRSKQKQIARQKAQEDYTRLLNQFHELEARLNQLSSDQSNTNEDTSKASASPPSSFQTWMQKWKTNVEQLWKRNRKRPDVEYCFVEQRTGHFLQYDLQKLEKLASKLQALLRASKPSEEREIQELRKTFRDLQQDIRKHMQFLELRSPIAPDAQKKIHKTLKTLEKLVENALPKQLSSTPNSSRISRKQQQQFSRQVRKSVRLLYGLGEHLPETGFKYLLELVKRMKKLQNINPVKDPEKTKEQLERVEKQFHELRHWIKKYQKQ